MEQQPQVLLYEPNQTLRNLIYSTLDSNGYNVSGVSDLSLAMDSQPKGENSIVICNMNQIEDLDKAMRLQNKFDKNSVLITISANIEVKDQLSVYPLKRHVHLTKPFNLSVFLAEIHATRKLFENIPFEHFREVLSGDISVIPLAEILQLFQLQQVSGILRIEDLKSGKIIVSFRNGLIDLVQSVGTSIEFRLGRYFIEKNLISIQDLKQIVSNIQIGLYGSKHIGEALIHLGKITKDDLTRALTQQSSELIYNLLRWENGRFGFSIQELTPEAKRANLGLGASNLVFEGFRRMDELNLMQQKILPENVYLVDPIALQQLDRAQLQPNEEKVLSAIDGTRNVNEIVLFSALNTFDATKALYQFLQSRVIRKK